jgi:UDP-N-acetylmuramate dehydrogenase
MKMKSLVKLDNYNTLNIKANAKHLINICSVDDLSTLYTQNSSVLNESIVIGAGSNILLTQPIYETILVNNIVGINIAHENSSEVELNVGAGVIWDQLVDFCVKHQFYGLENLSLIPGTVGAAPIQNIGAYGTEVKSCIHFVEAWDKQLNTLHRFNNKECLFAYRSSSFKTQWRNRYIITQVGFKLMKHQHFTLEYPALQHYLKENRINPTLANVRAAVIAIRQSKLPDPKKIPNAGSFFKNPIIATHQYHELRQKHPHLPHYFVCNQTVKIPAAWLIEYCGFKGKHHGQAAVHDKQALVLVNRGGATGNDILQLANLIQNTVMQQFGIALMFEVNVL